MRLLLLLSLSLACLGARADARYEACLAKPGTDCLFEQALERFPADDPKSLPALRAFALAALAVQRPRFAVNAMEHSLKNKADVPVPNPLFAEAAALKAEAQIALAQLAEADKSLDAAAAHALARPSGYEDRGADALVAAGAVIARAGRFVQARRLHGEALAHEAPQAYLILEAVGVEHSRRGHDAEALEVVAELFEPGVTSLTERGVARERLLAQIALRRLETGDRAALADLPALRSAPVRAEALLRALEIAERKKDAVMARDLRAALVHERMNIGEAFATMPGSAARRDLVHLHARALRMVTLDAAGRLGELAKQARAIEGDDERAAALCELGFTARRLQRVEEARELFAEGLRTADAATAIGACGYWARLAGNVEPARTALDARVEALRRMYREQSSAARFPDGATLLDLALAFAQLEQGEIRLGERSRMRP